MPSSNPRGAQSVTSEASLDFQKPCRTLRRVSIVKAILDAPLEDHFRSPVTLSESLKLEKLSFANGEVGDFC